MYLVAIHVYGVSKAQLAALLVIKMLGQNSIEVYIHQCLSSNMIITITACSYCHLQHNSLLSNRIELILMENKACELIKLLQSEFNISLLKIVIAV